MSRLGKKPIPLPSGVKFQLSGKTVTAEASKGKSSYSLPDLIDARIENSFLLLTRKDDSKAAKSLHGLSHALITNIIKGVSEGFSKQLEIQGVGYKAVVSADTLVLTLGFSHLVNFPVPKDLKIDVQKNVLITVSGTDAQRVGEISAQIRSIKPPEPYKGTGIRYVGERVRKKLGKAATK